MSNIDWREYIYSDQDILAGKPSIKGTRISVDFLLGLFEEGWSDKQILDNYPSLTKNSIKAVFAFTKECMSEESLYPLSLR